MASDNHAAIESVRPTKASAKPFVRWMGDRVGLELSAGGVVTAWILSIVVHAALFATLFVIVFPTVPMETQVVPVTMFRPAGELAPSSVVAAPESNVSITKRTLESDSMTIPKVSLLEPRPVDLSEPIHSANAPGLPGSASGDGSPSAGAGNPEELSVIGIGSGAGGGGENLGGLGLGPKGDGGAAFFGLGRAAPGAKRIVYVVDRSASMTETFMIVRQELRKSIGELRRSQKFHVIFFSSGATVENSPREPVSAIAANKEKFFRFLENVGPGGSTDPEPAMRRAFSLDPDLIYFLTDGEFDDSLVSRLAEWNRARGVSICTIAFFGADGAVMLERIARENHGEYRYVGENDLP